MFRQYFGNTVRARVGRIFHERNKLKRGYVAVSDLSDSSSSRLDSSNHSRDDDDNVEDSPAKIPVKTSVSVEQVGCSSVSAVKKNSNQNTKKKRRIYNLKQKKRKRLYIYIYWCHRPVVDFTKGSTEDYNNNYIIFL